MQKILHCCRCGEYQNDHPYTQIEFCTNFFLAIVDDNMTVYFRVNQGSHPGSTLHGPPHHATTIQGQAAHAQALAPQPHAQVL